jgi:hypothetical protein
MARFSGDSETLDLGADTETIAGFSRLGERCRPVGAVNDA